MDSFEFNKIAGAVLGSVLVLLVVSNIGNTLVAPKPLEKPVYVVEGAVDAVPFKSFGIDIFQFNPTVVGNASVRQSFRQRFVTLC